MQAVPVSVLSAKRFGPVTVLQSVDFIVVNKQVMIIND